MEILEYAKALLLAEKIQIVSALPLEKCNIKRPHLLRNSDFTEDRGTVIIFAVPYYVDDKGERNLSLYAVSRDYHLFFASLFERLLPRLSEEFPNNRFLGFSDHSPIDEVSAAAMAGLGVVGENRLLITEEYSSFVFLGEIICDAELDLSVGEIKRCERCGLCKGSCPVGLDVSRCISALTQKKGSLGEDERKIIRENGSSWGCDICQTACPHSKGIMETQVDFFKEERVPFLTRERVYNMSEEAFLRRAYSWRKKETILRNLEIFEREG